MSRSRRHSAQETPSSRKTADAVPLGGLVDDAAIVKEGYAIGDAGELENGRLYLQELVHSGEVAIELVHRPQAIEALPVQQRYERRLPAIKATEQRVTATAAARKAAESDVKTSRAQTAQHGYALVNRQTLRGVFTTAVLLIVLVSDLYVLGSAYAVMGVGNEPLFWFLPVTGQHLATLGTVLCLGWLAHGDRHRPPAPTEAAPSANGGLFDQLGKATEGFRLRLAGIAALILGLTLVREAYLVALGQSDLAVATGLFLINVGMVIGVRYIARSPNRPYTARPAAGLRHLWALCRLKLAQHECAAATAALVSLTGEQNADMALLQSLGRRTDHEARALALDTDRKVKKAAGAMLAGLREPIETSPFNGDLPGIKVAAPDIAAPPRLVELRPAHRYERYESAQLGGPQAEDGTELEPLTAMVLPAGSEPGQPAALPMAAPPDAEGTATGTAEDHARTAADAADPAEPALDQAEAEAEPPVSTSKKDAARARFAAEIGRLGHLSPAALGTFFVEHFDVHPATGRKWAAEFRREDPPSRNGHQGGWA